MRSARPRHGSSPKGPLHAATHSALPRSHKSPPAGQLPRQHAIPVRCRSIPPTHATRPGVRRQARLPGSAPLHRRTPSRPRQPKSAPHPAARCRRVPVAEAPCTPRPRQAAQPPCRDAAGEALRVAVRAGGVAGSRPLHRACEEGASGKRVSSRAVLTRAAAFGVAGSSGTFSSPDHYST